MAKSLEESLEASRRMRQLQEGACRQMLGNPDGFFACEFHSEAIQADTERWWQEEGARQHFAQQDPPAPPTKNS
jgi:hypothetical protein